MTIEKKENLMTIEKKIKEYSIKQAALKAEAQFLKNEFSLYLKDKNIPLITRWNFFVNADNDFKNHSDYILRANSEGLKYIMDSRFNAPEVYGRGKRIYLTDLFEEVVEDENIYIENFNSQLEPEKALELLTSALEEILSKNIGSFCFDW